MATARVFKSGNSQAVRLPKAFRLKGPEVEITRRGDEIVLREKPSKKKKGMVEILDLLAAIPDDVFDNIKDERPPQERKGL
jgi:antitoxin VapB